MFPWTDIDPSEGGTITYKTRGTAPNRRFVLTFDAVPYYACNSDLYTGQLKLFETTINIEMHIENNFNCEDESILGIHNYNGTFAVADKNYGVNSTYTNYANRFEPQCAGACIVLPITLTQFDGTPKDDLNDLYWSTASEINNDNFILENSTDGKNFNELSKIKGAGNSNTLKYYNYIHYTPNDIEYYRLKQVDFNGKYSYSKIIAVRAIKEQEINIFPNPSKENFTFEIRESNDEAYTIIYTNLLGSKSKEEVLIHSGTNHYQVNKFGDLPEGIYFVQIINEIGEVIKSEKVIKK